jgi:hypothetical protein
MTFGIIIAANGRAISPAGVPTDFGLKARAAEALRVP